MELSMEHYVVCQNCGERISTNFSYCSKCGAEQQLKENLPQLKIPEKEQHVPESDEIKLLRAEMDYLTSKLDSTDPENQKGIHWYETLKKQFDSGEIRLTEFDEALMQYLDWIEFRIPVIEEIIESS